MATGTQVIKNLIETGALDNEHVPVAGWYHFPLIDWDEDRFVEHTIDVVERNDWDLVKIMTNGNYLPIAYGADYHYSTNPHKWDGVFFSHPINSADDAASLGALDPHENPILAKELRVTRRLAEHFRGEKPIIATIFDPLTWIEELSTTPMQAPFTLRLLREHPEQVEKAIAAIRATNDAYIDALIEAGVDGFFVSSKFSNSEFLSPAEHERFVIPELERIFERVKGRTWFNMLHVHGEAGLYLKRLLELDFQALNWENVGPSPYLTTLRSLRPLTDKILVAGYDHLNDFDGTRAAVKRRLTERLETALAENAGGPFIFGPGCCLSLDADESLFDLVAEVAEETGHREARARG